MKLDHEIIKKVDEILSRGLCSGLGEPDGQMCIEAATSLISCEPFSGRPKCVHVVVRDYGARINDAPWSSADARASGLRSLLLAQLGSDAIDGAEFSQRLTEQTIRELLPRMLRDVLPDSPDVIEAATRCEREGTSDAAVTAYRAAIAAKAKYAAAAAAAIAADAADAVNAARAAAYADAEAALAAIAAGNAKADSYLIQSAELAVRVLSEMGSQGCQLLELENETRPRNNQEGR